MNASSRPAPRARIRAPACITRARPSRLDQGISRQATNKHIKQFENENLVATDMRKFIVRNMSETMGISLET